MQHAGMGFNAAPSIRSVRQGHFANCSATGSVVGLALLSMAAVGAVVSAFADRFAAWTNEAPDDGPPDEGPPGGTRGPRLRKEGESAILAWEDPPALLELDPAGADAAIAAGAVEIGGDPAVPGALTAPTEVHVALSARCPAPCTGCYQDARPDGALADRAALEADLDALAAMGVFEIAVGGGEPMRSADLEGVVDGIVARGMVANVTTSGLGVTPERARWLAGRVGQVNVSIDGLAGAYDAVRGWAGADHALTALRSLRTAGVRVAVNTVISAANLDHLDALGDVLAGEGIADWHWIRFKPVGRGRDSALAPSAEQLDGLWTRLLALEARTGLVIRVDCALAPFVLAAAPDLEAAARLGVTGCAGGVSLWARGTDGRFSPCSYAAGASEALVAGTAPRQAWRADPVVLGWRERAVAPPGPCAACPAQTLCRGGCRVVALARTGDALAPDPDCPRVRAWAA